MKLKKSLTLFSLMGLFYINTEVFYNAIHTRELALVGSSSLWMWLVGGFLGVILGEMSPGGLLLPAKVPYRARVFLGGTTINAVELLSGLFLNVYLGLGLWDYSMYFLNVAGQVCLYHAVLWYAFTPFVFWLDDVMRHYLYDSQRPAPLPSYYTSLISR